MKRYIAAITLIGLFFVIAANTNNASVAPEGYENLQVLPKDISKDKLDSIMGTFSVSLGVRCNFCHAANKDTTIKRLDFASDENHHKDIARAMMKMTADINANYFNATHSTQPDTIHAIVCYTCHRGKKEPDSKVFIALVDSTLKSFRKK